MDADLAFQLWGLGAVFALLGAAYLAGRLVVLAVGDRSADAPPSGATKREVTFAFVDCPRHGYAVVAAERCRECPWLRKIDNAGHARYVVCGPPA